jgi:thiosulfate/3-mercaptopyruvate sulfurtransferase
MNSDILISAARLNELIQSGACTVVDCRFDFTFKGRGRQDWLAGHVPGAFYAHLDDDLAAPVTAGSGRHPLPETNDFAKFLASIGWVDGKLLVAYDAGSNAISSRLWWMMRYYGQPSALLDGGLAAWVKAGYALEAGETRTEAATPETLVPRQDLVVSTDTIYRNPGRSGLSVLDARAAERFSGEVENLDSKAGHIPGALNRPFDENLDDDGFFKSPENLRLQFEEILAGAAAADLVHSCGSGVTACHNLFAMELAGYGTTRLYPGSWSEWIRDEQRPIETGP